MGLWDSISSGFNSIGGWNTIGSIANTAGTVYDLYNSIQSSNQANALANLAFGSAQAQDKYAQESWERQKQLYWPLENLNIQYQTQDLQTLRPAYQQQVAYQAQRMGEELAQAQRINPLLDETRESLISRLVQGEDVLAERMMSQVSADVGTAYGAQREQDVRSMGLAGINPNSGQFSNYLNRMGTSQALAESTGRTQAARQAEELSMSRQAQALNYAAGAQLPTYSYTPSVNASSITSGLGAAGSQATGLAQMYNQNAQNSMSGAWYGLNALSGGAVNQYRY